MRLLAVLMLLALLLPLFSPASVRAQGRDPAAEIIQRMTPEEKIGQLFLVTFNGTEVDPESQLYDLIVNHHIGGVVLSAANDNFVAENTISETLNLTNAIQEIEWNSSVAPATPATTESPHTYIPLLIGISQEGGGSPNDQILSGLTTLPDQMAVGAAWDRSLAEQTGQAMGRELSALGFNLYFGLSLDVLTLTSPETNSDLNTRVFGGDPYWVGEMARSYVFGLHSGSEGRMAVIAKHFPGRGSSDRPAQEEISTVRRSLEELKSIELAPFFVVTGNAPDAASTVDGLLVSHIRYQGFQGNIRATTRPISFDQQALGQILDLLQVSGWRENGGLLISDDLGTQAVRQFYDPDRKVFAGRLVARDAFLAGNDLLYMGNIVSSDAPDTYTTVVRTLEFFVQKYREDSAFASRVDESLHRILSLKFKLFNTFILDKVQPAAAQMQDVGKSDAVVFEVARQAATLIDPALADLPAVLPSAPSVSDYILFITDVRTARQCSVCPDIPLLDRDTFQKAVFRLYGPSAGGLVSASHLSSYSFDDLTHLLDNTQPMENFVNELRRANWIIISTLDLPSGSTQATALRRFLSERQSLLSSKKVILFSFAAPYYLDATDISKLTAFYGLYSESAPFVDVAARLLFREVTPAGALPVSVPGIGYDLISATAPDPNQVIKLNLDLPPAPTPQATLSPEPTTAPLFRVSDTISVRTGVILDHNQRPVPDGTVVRFTLSQGESGLIQQVEAFTSRGTAVAAFRLDTPGLIEIRASSEPARVSDTIQLPVSNEGAPIIIITPTLEATPIPTPTIPVPTPSPTPEPFTVSNGYPNVLGWLLVMFILASSSGLAYWVGGQVVETRWAVRWALLMLAGGLLGYNYLVLGFPGTEWWLDGRGLPAFLQGVLIGEALGFVGGWVWWLTSEGGDQAQEQ